MTNGTSNTTEYADTSGLPTLIGTKDRIAWAATIRASKIVDLPNLPVSPAVEHLFAKTDVKFWIDFRLLTTSELIMMVSKNG